MTIVDKDLAEYLLISIIELEETDYLEQCDENDWIVNNTDNPHPYAQAHLALGLAIEL